MCDRVSTAGVYGVCVCVCGVSVATLTESSIYHHLVFAQ